MKFSELNLIPELMDGLDAMGFEECTPVQEMTMPVILEDRDLIACAQTGTGKTAAYLLPILHKLSNRKEHSVNTIILVPTRELAIQIDQQMEGFSYFTPVTSVAIYGGGEADAWETQKVALKKGADVIIATPGRLLSHMNLKLTDFSKVEHFILDEADRMLDMGFYDDIIKVTKELPEKRQTLLFSATMPPKIRKLADSILQRPEVVNIAVSKPAEGILQAAYMIYEEQKIPLLKHLLTDKKELQSIVIFTSRKANVNNIVRELSRAGFSVAGIHSDLDQQEREAVLRDFKNMKKQIMVATDIIARGIDIDTIDLVLNYDVPADPEDYVHRIGRTARAQRTGVGLTLITPNDQQYFKKIEDLIEKGIYKIQVPPELGETPEYNPKEADKKRKKNFSKKSGGKKFRKAGERHKPDVKKGEKKHWKGKKAKPQPDSSKSSSPE